MVYMQLLVMFCEILLMFIFVMRVDKPRNIICVCVWTNPRNILTRYIIMYLHLLMSYYCPDVLLYVLYVNDRITLRSFPFPLRIPINTEYNK